MQSYLERLRLIDWDFPNAGRKDEIHSIHPYPAKFIPEIPHYLLKTIPIPDNSWVLDPFCGSGATLVEAQKHGTPSLGIDLNPIACLISVIKTQPLVDDVIMIAKEITLQAKIAERDVTVPNIPNLSHWFETQVQRESAALINQINAVQCLATKNLLRLAFSSILVRVSKQESDTRYAAIEKNFVAGDVYKLFLTACERIQAAKYKHQPKTWDCHIIQQNILTISPSDINKPIGLVITSPPYPNAYEYWLYHKYRMYWLGYDPIQVKEQEIGARAHYFKKNPPSEDDFRCQMHQLMSLLSQVVISGGHVCMVIGRSKIHGKLIDNASVIIEQAKENSFAFLTKITRNIAPSRKSFNLAHANIKTEDILVFKR